ncbi:hypothetical protein ACRN96_05735 [Shewanella oncorhynchi]|jgi:hypothetical protein|uniref:hypothetical protein n=1 Tax=Shewanella TaxID=22 RepID=UPI001C2005E7|nr:MULTISPECIES: hypothetical protein [unclassified Shewanella]MCU7984490.1 hypothetical protein [Shewanella sp. SW24]MCU8106168.1 hypothetical protein [Shewanella sp. SM101]
MMCFKSGFAALLDISLWAGWANIVMAIVAVLALLFARTQVESARRDSRRASAYAAYSEYLKLCIENESFARGMEIEITRNEDDYSKYRWFVANMLFAFEQVLEVCKDDPTWKETIRHQLLRHKWHLDKSGSAKRDEWGADLKDLFPK